MTKTIAQALLHRGLKKTQNEDNLLFQNAWALPSERDAYERSAVFEDSIQVYAVANGQGGPDIGDIAAETALAILLKQVWRIDRNSGFVFSDFARQYVDQANQSILRLLERYRGLPVGTTLAALILYKDTAYTLGIGNCRIFLYRDSTLYSLTHSPDDPGEQSQKSRRHYLGMLDGDALLDTLDLTQTVLLPGDLFLLATDGVTDSVTDDLIAHQLGTPNAFIQNIRQIQQQVFNAGAPDNLALIGLRVVDLSISDEKDQSGRKKKKKKMDTTVRQPNPVQEMTSFRWFKPLLFFLLFVLIGLVLAKLLFSMPDWLVRLLQGH